MRVLVLAAFVALLLYPVAASESQPMACHAAGVVVYAAMPEQMAARAMGMALHATTDWLQEPGQDPPGNPGHGRPEHNCSTGGRNNTVNCPCAKYVECGEDNEPVESDRCKSYCHKDMCLCAKPCA